MKTTVEISDVLLRSARRLAATRGTTLRAVIEDALRRTVGARPERRPYRLPSCAFKGRGLQPGIRDGDWQEIRRLAYEGRGG